MLNNRKEFISNYWKYYCILEDDFAELIKYIDLRKSNYRTTSNVIIKQLQSICSEFEIVCKELCDIKMDDKHANIKTYYKGIVDNTQEIIQDLKIRKIQNLHINIRQTNNMVIFPFKEWNEECPWNLFWWKNHNDIKHSRTEHYKSGNFESVLNALGALYFLERLLVRKVYYKTKEMDIPDRQSSIFYIENFGYKWSIEDEVYNKAKKE